MELFSSLLNYTYLYAIYTCAACAFSSSSRALSFSLSLFLFHLWAENLPKVSSFHKKIRKFAYSKVFHFFILCVCMFVPTWHLFVREKEKKKVYGNTIYRCTNTWTEANNSNLNLFNKFTYWTNMMIVIQCGVQYGMGIKRNDEQAHSHDTNINTEI